MRKEKEMINLFKNIVMNDDGIRLSVLEGSRTNQNIPKDDFQDYDISFFVTDIAPYKKDDDWLNIFGNMVFMQKPEDMELFPAEFEHWFTYIMYFNDGIKIDLSLIPLDEVNKYFSNSDGLVEILVDKDDRISKAIIPSDIKYWTKKPNEQEFDDCCNEFWNVSAYVAKGLFRKELLFALDHFNQILRPELLRMISWEVGLRKGFNFSVGKNYKFIDQYLPEKEFDKLTKTFSLSGYRESWESFELCCQMFRTYSKKVASSLGYKYPEYDQKMTRFIRNVYEKLSEK
ncbi:MAG TPA: aminoglycoside 6-adenylyltransferase [Cerasibacillus sp.]|uniref:Aminoglycoside 6-adenylyltransferase n=1 Tax=Siminovitchia thermophila TaxID=1245522 RepID=A0ABS2R0Z1_9BACI|nr:aminoglycoside 6-adenylyltransferase [Siminovitchia thermophila]MBM7713292.1 aminoglycoside 6-adenylyltransferase [Siminovitchia thermophila]